MSTSTATAELDNNSLAARKLSDFLWHRQLDSLSNRTLADSLRGNHETAARLRRGADGARALTQTDVVALLKQHDDSIELLERVIERHLLDEARRRLLPAPRRGARVTLAQLLARYADRLERVSDTRYRARCAWHDDTRPSLVVFDDHAHCFACGAHHTLAELAKAWRCAQ